MDRTDRAARLVAYGAAVCGGAFACLLLFSAPAQADDAAIPDPAEAVGAVGELAGDVTRAAGGAAGAVVEDVAQEAPVGREVVEHAGEAVTETTDTVASVVEQATDAVSPPTPPAPDPPSTPVSPPAPENPEPEPPAAADADDRAGQHAPGDRPRPERRAQPRQRAGDDRAADRISATTPAGPALADVLTPGRAADHRVGHGLSLAQLLAPCDGCPDAADAAAGADSPTLQALPGETWLSPPTPVAPASRAGSGAHPAPAPSPDVSPD